MKRTFYFILLVSILITSCGQHGDYKAFVSDPNLYCKTVKKLNDIVLENNFPPMIASRNYVYANIAAYETMAAGDNNYQSLSGQIKHLPQMPRPDTTTNKIDFHFAALLAFCQVGNAVTFPEGSMDKYVEQLKHDVDSAGMPSSIFNNSIAFAKVIGDTILKWSKKDNYAQTRSAPKYSITNIDGKWVPTPPMYAQALEAHWMDIRAMTMDSAAQFMPPPPPTFDIKNKNSEYYKNLLAVKNAGDSLTPEQKHIADFWDDNAFKMNVSGHLMFATKKFSPAGHWMNIAGIASQKSKADFNTTICGYTKTSIALFDAFIECWKAKFTYATARPETVINKYFAQDWQPYIQTPPFPEYTCGHSTISSAAAEALTSVYGDNMAYTDSSELEFGIKNRDFTSFRQAALENNWARFYGGIHLHNSCIVSTEYGKKVGDWVVNKLVMKKNEIHLNTSKP